MNIFKVILFLVVVFSALRLNAQQKQHLIPFSNRLLINPSFAGLNEYTNLWTGIEYLSISDKETDMQYSLTYDLHSDKLNGGIGFYFTQGIHGISNTSSTALGISYAGLKTDLGKGEIITSFQTNYLFANKQWFVCGIDNILDKEEEPPSLPGGERVRYKMLEPKFGMLYEGPKHRVGLTAGITLKKSVAIEEIEKNGSDIEFLPLSFTFYYARKTRGGKNGLKSKPYVAYPEFIVLYNNSYLLSRTSLKVERTHQTLGLFIQNDFTNKQHQFGGTYGWRFDNLRINVTSGVGIPYLSEKFTFLGEVTLGLIIPPVRYSEKNPWAPARKLF